MQMNHATRSRAPNKMAMQNSLSITGAYAEVWIFSAQRRGDRCQVSRIGTTLRLFRKAFRTVDDEWVSVEPTL